MIAVAPCLNPAGRRWRITLFRKLRAYQAIGASLSGFRSWTLGQSTLQPASQPLWISILLLQVELSCGH